MVVSSLGGVFVFFGSFFLVMMFSDSIMAAESFISGFAVEGEGSLYDPIYKRCTDARYFLAMQN